MKTHLIVAIDEETRGIGFKGKIPWLKYESLTSDITQVNRQTYLSDRGKMNAFIIGHNTWEYLLGSAPLKDRVNVVISKSLKPIQGVVIVRDYESAIQYLESLGNIQTAYIIGGGKTFEKAMQVGVDNITVSSIRDYGDKFDMFFQEIPDTYRLFSANTFRGFTRWVFYKHRPMTTSEELSNIK